MSDAAQATKMGNDPLLIDAIFPSVVLFAVVRFVKFVRVAAEAAPIT